MASSGEVADCNQLNTPPSPLSLQAYKRIYSVCQVPVTTSKMMSLSTTASNSHTVSSDEVTLDRYLEIVFSYLRL